MFKVSFTRSIPIMKNQKRDNPNWESNNKKQNNKPAKNIF